MTHLKHFGLFIRFAYAGCLDAVQQAWSDCYREPLSDMEALRLRTEVFRKHHPEIFANIEKNNALFQRLVKGAAHPANTPTCRRCGKVHVQEPDPFFYGEAQDQTTCEGE